MLKYRHTMVRVADLDTSMDFYCRIFGLEETRRTESEKGRYTLVFLAAPADADRARAERVSELELTYNWDPEVYTGGRNFGHLAYEVDNIYDFCQHLEDHGVVINRPPRDGRIAFVRSPDGISIELIQKNAPLLPVPAKWEAMGNTGSW